MKKNILMFFILITAVSCVYFVHTDEDLAFNPVLVPDSKEGQWAAFLNGKLYEGSLGYSHLEGDTLKLQLTKRWDISIPIDEMYSGSMVEGAVIRFGVWEELSVMENSSVWLRHVSDSTISGFFCFSGECKSFDEKKWKAVATDGTFASMISRQ